MRERIPVQAAILFSVCFCGLAKSYCIESSLQTEITASTKRLRQYCEYKSSTGATVRLFPGSELYTTDCLRCQCSLTGLSCCGFGSHAGVVAVPDGCVAIQDGCEKLYVKKNDSSIDCQTGQSINLPNLAFKPHPDNFIGLEKAATEKAKMSKRQKQAQASNEKALFIPKPQVEPLNLMQVPSAQTWKYLLPDLSPTKLGSPRPISDILHEIMTKHIPADTRSPRLAPVDTVPLNSQPVQTRVETTSGGVPHPWHAPLNIQPYYQSSSPGSWLPWLFIE